MTNMDTAPQPVNDEQDQGANAPEPITIKAEGPFGVISWTPGEHTQEHLQELDEEELAEFLAHLQKELGSQAAAMKGLICDTMAITALYGLLMSASERDELPMPDFDAIITGKFPRF